MDDTAAVATLPHADPATRPDDGSARLRHDLRNALMPLLLHFDLLDLHTRGAAPAAAASPADIAANIQRLANGLLRRTADHAATSVAQRLDLHLWWKEIGDLVRAPLSAPADLSVSVSAKLPPVWAQPTVLAQVILHVLVGVRLARPVTAPRQVHLSARRTAQGVTISVRDTTDRLSLPRSRASAALAAAWGLSLARSLLRECGGDLTGYSAPDSGTHVIIRLPGADAAERPSVGVTAEHVAVAARPLSLQREHDSHPTASGTTAQQARRVLIIDDNAALTTALALRLEIDGGFTCVPPLHALRDSAAYIAAQMPAIVLLDLNLPGDESPLDVIRALQAQASAVRVVILTGNPSAEAVAATREAGAAGFIAKGVAPDRLLSALRRVGQEPFVLALDN